MLRNHHCRNLYKGYVFVLVVRDFTVLNLEEDSWMLLFDHVIPTPFLSDVLGNLMWITWFPRRLDIKFSTTSTTLPFLSLKDNTTNKYLSIPGFAGMVVLATKIEGFHLIRGELCPYQQPAKPSDTILLMLL